MKNVDVIIIGAGPAGATAARVCAEHGMRVALADKASFPRDKTCGGAISKRAAGLLPFPLDPPAARDVDRVRVSTDRGVVERAFREPFVAVTERRWLDLRLVEEAVKAGVDLHERAPLREVTRAAKVVRARVGNDLITGRILIGADGANGLTAALSGIPVRHRHGIAMEAAAPLPEHAFADRTIDLEIGAPPGGYGWLFPKPGRSSLGVGGSLNEAPRLRALLARAAARFGVDPRHVSGARAHRLPVRHRDSPLFDGNVLLAGDAAGLVNPLTGEGISAALASGRLAAEHAAACLLGRAPDLSSYSIAVEASLGRENESALALADLLHTFPGLAGVAIRRSSALWEIGERVLHGGVGLDDATRGLGLARCLMAILSTAGAARRWLRERLVERDATSARS